MLPTWRHPDDDGIEQYCLQHLRGCELELLEEHLLLCRSCQARVTKCQRDVDSWRRALKEPLLRESVPTRDRICKRNVFVTHGGSYFTHVEKICSLLRVFELAPIVVKNMPSLGLSITDRVETYMRLSCAGIVLATVDDDDGTRHGRTRDNVNQEGGMLQIMPNIDHRIVYMKEPGVELASNWKEKAWINFSRERIEDSFIPLLRELKGFALIS